MKYTQMLCERTRAEPVVQVEFLFARCLQNTSYSFSSCFCAMFVLQNLDSNWRRWKI